MKHANSSYPFANYEITLHVARASGRIESGQPVPLSGGAAGSANARGIIATLSKEAGELTGLTLTAADRTWSGDRENPYCLWTLCLHDMADLKSKGAEPHDGNWTAMIRCNPVVTESVAA